MINTTDNQLDSLVTIASFFYFVSSSLSFAVFHFFPYTGQQPFGGPGGAGIPGAPGAPGAPGGPGSPVGPRCPMAPGGPIGPIDPSAPATCRLAAMKHP